MLVEIGATDDSAEARLLAAIESLGGIVGDTVVGEPGRLWEVRHTIPTITEQMNPVTTFDISTARSALTALRTELRRKLAVTHPDITPVELGHYGDGGLSTSSCPFPPRWPPAVETIRRLVLDTVVREFGGSFSAEHGIGPKNAESYIRYVPEGVRLIAKSLKQHLDPYGILGWRAG